MGSARIDAGICKHEERPNLKIADILLTNIHICMHIYIYAYMCIYIYIDVYEKGREKIRRFRALGHRVGGLHYIYICIYVCTKSVHTDIHAAKVGCKVGVCRRRSYGHMYKVSGFRVQVNLIHRSRRGITTSWVRTGLRVIASKPAAPLENCSSQLPFQECDSS